MNSKFHRIECGLLNLLLGLKFDFNWFVMQVILEPMPDCSHFFQGVLYKVLSFIKQIIWIWTRFSQFSLQAYAQTEISHIDLLRCTVILDVWGIFHCYMLLLLGVLLRDAGCPLFSPLLPSGFQEARLVFWIIGSWLQWDLLLRVGVESTTLGSWSGMLW